MPKKQKFPTKDICKKMERLEMKPLEDYGFIENDLWYPNEHFLEETHDLVIREYGGYSGLEVGLEPFKTILEKAKDAEDIFLKAAIFLRDIVTARIFVDGNHRTAILTCETFLNQNGKKLWTDNSQALYMFIKGILAYTYEEIAELLEHGP